MEVDFWEVGIQEEVIMEVDLQEVEVEVEMMVDL